MYEKASLVTHHVQDPGLAAVTLVPPSCISTVTDSPHRHASASLTFISLCTDILANPCGAGLIPPIFN